MTTTSINPQTDEWITARECDDDIVLAYAAARNLDTDDVAAAATNIVVEIAGLHRFANVSLTDVRESLTNLIAAAEYLLGTLPEEVRR